MKYSVSKLLLFPVAFFLFILSSFFYVLIAYGQDTVQPFSDENRIIETYYKGEIVDASIPSDENYDTVTQHITIRLLTGEKKGQEIQIDHTYTPNKKEPAYKKGDTLVVLENSNEKNTLYLIVDRYRLPALAIIVVIFFILAIVFAQRRGAFAIAGLGMSILLLAYWVVPQIAAGKNPLIVGGGGAIVISLISLYIAHGFHQRTTIALLGTLATIVIAALTAWGFVTFSSLFGLGSEDAYYLQSSLGNSIDLRGLFLVGIIIGSLGVLDDITTSLAATIEEIHKANPSLPFHELQKRGSAVGKEHIVSLINTLVLAYAGASLPLLLLLTMNQQPIWVVLNSQFLAEEIVRTLVGSIALMLAVPITTTIAARFYAKKETRILD